MRPKQFSDGRIGVALMTSIISPKLGYSIREACEATSLGRTTIYGHIADGRLKVTRIGGRTIIAADELQRFVSGDAR